MFEFLKKEEGQALMMVIAIISGVSLTLIGLNSMIINELEIEILERNITRSLKLADSGVERLVFELNQNITNKNDEEIEEYQCKLEKWVNDWVDKNTDEEGELQEEEKKEPLVIIENELTISNLEEGETPSFYQNNYEVKLKGVNYEEHIYTFVSKGIVNEGLDNEFERSKKIDILINQEVKGKEYFLIRSEEIINN